MGGSTGQASILLATRFPQLHFTVQDLPETIAGRISDPSALDAFIASRVTFGAHDFFTPQPVTSAEVYFLRKICHDWSDADAISILQLLAIAMQPDARILIMDTILPPQGSIPPLQEALLRVRDLTMTQNFNSRERELDDWIGLFERVKPKLRLKDYKQPYGSSMAIMVLIKDESLL